MKGFEGFYLEGQNLALTVLCVPYLLDSDSGGRASLRIVLFTVPQLKSCTREARPAANVLVEMPSTDARRGGEARCIELTSTTVQLA